MGEKNPPTQKPDSHLFFPLQHLGLQNYQFPSDLTQSKLSGLEGVTLLSAEDTVTNNSFDQLTRASFYLFIYLLFT